MDEDHIPYLQHSVRFCAILLYILDLTGSQRAYHTRSRMAIPINSKRLTSLPIIPVMARFAYSGESGSSDASTAGSTYSGDSGYKPAPFIDDLQSPRVDRHKGISSE